MLIQYLLQKLKTGDATSINLNATPGKLATRFDIADFLDINPELLDDFLLEKGFDINKDAYGKSQLIINDEKLYIEDDNGTLLPIDTLFDNIVNTIQNANN